MLHVLLNQDDMSVSLLVTHLKFILHDDGLKMSVVLDKIDYLLQRFDKIDDQLLGCLVFAYSYTDLITFVTDISSWSWLI